MFDLRTSGLPDAPRRPPRNASAPPAPGAAGGGIAGLRPIAPIGAGRSWHAWLDAVRLTLSFTFVLKAARVRGGVSSGRRPCHRPRGSVEEARSPVGRRGPDLESGPPRCTRSRSWRVARGRPEARLCPVARRWAVIAWTLLEPGCSHFSKVADFRGCCAPNPTKFGVPPIFTLSWTEFGAIPAGFGPRVRAHLLEPLCRRRLRPHKARV